MNKKGNFTLVIIISCIILIIFVSLIVGLIIAIQKGKKDEVPQNETSIKLYLMAESLGQQLDSKYLVLNDNNTIISNGNLSSDSWTEIKIPNINQTKVICSKNDYYTSINNHTISELEISLNASRFKCELNQAGNLTITHEGNLLKDENIIALTVSTNKVFKRLSFTASWSAGVLDVQYYSGFKCPQWINYTIYDERKGYIWLPEKNYLCGDELYICDEISPIQECILKENISERFGTGVDKAFTISKTLNNESYSFGLLVKTIDTRSPNDYIELIFYDKDLEYNNGEFSYSSELNGENSGNKRDFVYRIYLNGTNF